MAHHTYRQRVNDDREFPPNEGSIEVETEHGGELGLCAARGRLGQDGQRQLQTQRGQEEVFIRTRGYTLQQIVIL